MALVNSTTDTLKIAMLKERTDTAWLSRLLVGFKTSGQETDRVYSYNPEARTGLLYAVAIGDVVYVKANSMEPIINNSSCFRWFKRTDTEAYKYSSIKKL